MLQRGSYSEETARECFRQLLEGVRYCHSLGVVHRDLKLENLLLEEEHDLSRIRIVDFGLAKGHFHKRAMSMDTVCGTPHYVAPEVIIVRTALPCGCTCHVGSMSCCSAAVKVIHLIAVVRPVQHLCPAVG